MSSPEALLSACTTDKEAQHLLLTRASEALPLWDNWLLPLGSEQETGEDPALENRLARSGGMDSLIPQNSSAQDAESGSAIGSFPQMSAVKSALLFEVQARHLKFLRMKAGRNETDIARLMPEMDALLAGLIAIDPARAMVLCG